MIWRRMGCVAMVLLILSFAGLDALTAELPPYPRAKSKPAKDPGPAARERQLFRRVRLENRQLQWDSCLAEQARQRARQMLKDGYFDHRDPATGQNEAWELIAECDAFRFGGENLAKGAGSSDKIHRTLMKSPTHRKNILDRRFDRVGIGCFENLCVQFFAGR